MLNDGPLTVINCELLTVVNSKRSVFVNEERLTMDNEGMQRDVAEEDDGRKQSPAALRDNFKKKGCSHTGLKV
ncbi:hypothetical protein DXA26_04425 [Bacteroides fragilis]|nr:hypothetical protein DXB09_02205 [Bacteroides fragilis]RGY76000.1 hypothetical protein DXA26_04425 [Bacteroides fragilis]